MRRFIFIPIILLVTTNAFAKHNNPFAFHSTEISQSDANQKTAFIKLNFAPGKSVLKILNAKKPFIFCKNATIHYDPRTRLLILHAPSHALKQIQLLLRKIDIPANQVILKAKIINIDKDYIHNLGMTFAQSNSPNSTSASSTDHALIPIFYPKKGNLINLHLNLLEKHGHANIIASPTLFTLNNTSASIESGTEIPYQQNAKDGGTSIAFKKAVLALKVTPTILPKHNILLKLHINQDTPSSLSVNGEPAISTQAITTTLVLRSGHTAILGGILSNHSATSTTGVPLLQNIPAIGKLFQSSRKIIKHNELLLLVTPIIKSQY